jgi:hypothetical protein
MLGVGAEISKEPKVKRDFSSEKRRARSWDEEPKQRDQEA